MLLCINYVAENKRDYIKRTFRPWQQMNTQTAYLFGADKVREYSPKDISQDFYEKNKFILDQSRGAGGWLWKPYIIKDAMSSVDFGDYVLYLDTGAFCLEDIHLLIDAMEKANSDVMCFDIGNWATEKNFTKRDAFILMDCDSEEYIYTNQRFGGVVLFKKTPESIALIDEWLEYAQDPRIITDIPNQLGKENYEGFTRNLHDQTVWSLLTKKKGIKPFRNPFQHSNKKIFSEEVLARSNYPRIFLLHRCDLRQNNIIPLIPQIISVMKRVEDDKELIPKEFQYGLPQMVKESLANLIALFIDVTTAKPITYLPTPQEILDSCKELDMPETPLLKEALSKLSTPPKQAVDKDVSTKEEPAVTKTAVKPPSSIKEPAVTKTVVKPPSSISDYYALALKNSSLEDALLKLSYRQDLTTPLK